MIMNEKQSKIKTFHIVNPNTTAVLLAERGKGLKHSLRQKNHSIAGRQAVILSNGMEKDLNEWRDKKELCIEEQSGRKAKAPTSQA